MLGCCTICTWRFDRADAIQTRGVKCWGCERRGLQFGRFCPQCGVEEPTLETQEEELRCNGCGKPRVTTKFCPECGALGRMEVDYRRHNKVEVLPEGWRLEEVEGKLCMVAPA